MRKPHIAPSMLVAVLGTACAACMQDIVEVQPTLVDRLSGSNDRETTIRVNVRELADALQAFVGPPQKSVSQIAPGPIPAERAWLGKERNGAGLTQLRRVGPYELPAQSLGYCIRVYECTANGPAGVTYDRVSGVNILPVFGAWLPQSAQPAPEPPKPPAAAGDKPAPAEPAKPKPASPPSLDELLGITPTPASSDAKTREAPKPEEIKALEDASKEDLDRLLTAAEMGDVFKQAVTLMNDAAKRLNDKQDPSVQTQRIQEDVVRKLDQLLAALDKQQDQQQQQQQQQPQDKPQNQPQRKQQQQQQQQGQEQGQSSDPQEGDRPSLQQGKLNPGIDSARAAWGALPARVREMLMQGSGDRFSSRYKQMTEEYYKRLAEEAGR